MNKNRQQSTVNSRQKVHNPKIKIAVGVLILFLISCSAVLAEEQAGSLTNSQIPQQFEGFNLQGYTDTGDKAWDVKGDKADINGNVIAISNVDANRYGDTDVNLKAQKGTIHKDSGEIFLEKDVVITSETGTQMKTDTLNWEKEKDLVSTDDPVSITDELKGMVANGKGLRAHPGLQTAQMNKDVTVEVDMEAQNPGSGKMVITSDGPMEIDQKNSVAVFNENVVAVQSGGRTLKADKVEMYFDPEKQQIREMVCIGHVQIIQGANITNSDRAVYSAATEKLTLYGRPKLILVTEGENSIAAFKKETN